MYCRKCASENLNKKGIYPNGKQRWICLDCGCQKFPVDNVFDADAYNEEKFEVTEDEIIKQNVRLAKQKQYHQDANRIERKSVREHIRFDNAVSMYVKELRDVIENYEIPGVEHSIPEHPKVLIVQLSDLHFNELVEDVVGNVYDFNVAGCRLKKFAKRIKLYAEFTDAKIIYLVMTGDLINSDRHLDELLSMATNRAKATFLGVELLAQFISDINEVANINIVSVTGNESRIREEYGYVDKLTTDNFDFMIYEILSIYFRNAKGVNFIKGDGTDEIININGKNFLAIHGVELKTMKTSNINDAISKWTHKGIMIDYVLCGHLHETKITDKLLRCGSLVGTNAFADKGLNLYGRASQNIHIVYKDGSVDSMRIDLQNSGDDGYYIEDKLKAYNAKSANKAKKLLKIVTYNEGVIYVN